MIGGADIQVEKGGFTRIHNAILEKLATTDLGSHEFRCLMFLFRQTYGYQKKDATLSLNDWEQGTGIDFRNVDKTIKRLQKRNILIRTGGGRGRGNIPTYSFNKYHEQWDKELNSYVDTNLMDKETRAEIRISEELNSYVDTKENSYVDMKCTSGLKKERKAESSLPAATHSDDPMALVRLAYQTVAKFGPPTTTDKGKEVLAVACTLIDTYGFDSCSRMLDKLKERNNAMIKANRQGIMAPIQFLKTLMEDSEPIPVRLPATVSFALEELV